MQNFRFLVCTCLALAALQATAADAPALLPSGDMFATPLNAPPQYPEASQRLREEGRVVVQVRISPAGDPLDVRVGQSSGFNRLDQAAMDAVNGWRFSAGAGQGGAPGDRWFSIPINFALAPEPARQAWASRPTP